MLVKYQVNDRTTIDVELTDVKQCFAFLSYADSVFGVESCGNCESQNLSFCHRQPKGFDYYSVKCNDCKHELKFGQQKDSGRLFPKGWEEPYYGGDEESSERGNSRRSNRDDSDHDEYNQDREPVAAGKGKGKGDLPF